MSQSLAQLKATLQSAVPARNGVPDSDQYFQAIKDAVADYSSRRPLKKHILLSVVSGTAAYSLPDDFSKIIDLEAVNTPGKVGYAASGKLVAFGLDFREDYSIVNGQITFVPTPGYTADRDLWYAARHVLTPDPAPSAWQASTTYSVGDLVQATSPGGVYYFECTTAGQSDSTEPSWLLTEGQTVTDGGVTWTTRSFAYADMTDDDARIVRLKAQVLALRLLSNQVAGEGWRYKDGDVEVDKSKQGQSYQSQIKFLEDEYQAAIRAAIGHVGTRTTYWDVAY